jgi:hypothetical protein
MIASRLGQVLARISQCALTVELSGAHADV